MGRYRDHRQPRSHGSDGDNEFESSEPSYFDKRATPRGSPVSTLPESDAEVLWFNAEKGFGFLKLSDGSEAFMHQSKLQAAGHTSLPTGALLRVRTEPGQKGPQVVEVVSVSPGTGVPSPEAAARRVPDPIRSTGTTEQQGSGVVKRYDSTKGFGFIALDGGGRDVFVHATTLGRTGITSLDVGQSVDITYADGPKGAEVRTLRIR